MRLKVWFILGLFLCVGCPAVKEITHEAHDVAVDCGPRAVVDEIPAILPAVAAILANAPIDWKQQMDVLRGTFGDSVVCAAAVVARDEAAAAAAHPTAERPSFAQLGPSPSSAWLMGGHFVITYPPPQQLKAPLLRVGGTVTYVPGHAP